MLTVKKYIFSRSFLLRATVVILGVLFATESLAATQLTVSAIQQNLSKGISNISIVMEDIALVAGIGFIFSSFFKFHQHKMNPTQVPLSQGVTLLVIGSGLAVFPHLLSTTTQGVFGQNVTTLGSSSISKVIGG